MTATFEDLKVEGEHNGAFKGSTNSDTVWRRCHGKQHMLQGADQPNDPDNEAYGRFEHCTFVKSYHDADDAKNLLQLSYGGHADLFACLFLSGHRAAGEDEGVPYDGHAIQLFDGSSVRGSWNTFMRFRGVRGGQFAQFVNDAGGPRPNHMDPRFSHENAFIG